MAAAAPQCALAIAALLAAWLVLGCAVNAPEAPSVLPEGGAAATESPSAPDASEPPPEYRDGMHNAEGDRVELPPELALPVYRYNGSAGTWSEAGATWPGSREPHSSGAGPSTASAGSRSRTSRA